MTDDVAKRRSNLRWRHVHDAVAKARVRAGAPVVALIRMQHGDLARQAALEATPVIERLHAELRHGDAVGVVAMQREAARQAGPQELHAADRAEAAHPIAARSFK